MAFKEALRRVADRVPETRLVMVMDTDGIMVDRLIVRPDPELEAVAAEYSTLLRASVSAANDTNLGNLQELSIVTERMIALLVSITPEYFIFAALSPGAIAGRARYALKAAAASLIDEFA